MTEYTPTTEVVRLQHTGGWHVESIPGRNALAEFDRWLAAHDAEVAANALRDAADVMDHRSLNTWGDYYGASLVEAIVDNMRVRAERIQREANPVD